MNTATHLVTGLLLGRLLLGRLQPGGSDHGDAGGAGPGSRTGHGSFVTMFCGVAALLPDLDSALGLPHAQVTHTAIAGVLLAVAWAGVAWVAGRPFLRVAGIGARVLLLVALAGVASHLVLDIFTYYDGDCLATAAHVYFWPVWGQSFHLDCIFGASEGVYLARVLIEWAFYSPLLLAVLVARWIRHKENPFAAFSPAWWLRDAGLGSFTAQATGIKASVVLLLGLSLAVIVVEALGYVT